MNYSERDNSFDVPCPNCLMKAKKQDEKLEKLWNDRTDDKMSLCRFLAYLKEHPELIEEYQADYDDSGFETLNVQTIFEYNSDGENNEVTIKIRANCSVCDASFRDEVSGSVD